MMAQRIPTPQEACADPCWFSRWGIHPELSVRLTIMAAQAQPLPLQIISGYRSPEEQEQLEEEGRPTAPYQLSTHGHWPATGADLRLPTVAVTDAVKATLGAWATYAGLRWGGGSPVDDKGIPSDWNHVDLGPRTDSVAVAYRQANP